MSKHEGVLPSSSFETRARPFELCGSSSMRAPQDEDGRARAELRLVAEPFAVIPISRCQTAHRVPAAHFCVRGLQLRFTHPEIEGWAERRETFGCQRAPVGRAVSRHARRLRGALRPMTQQYTGRNNVTISMPDGGSVPIVSQTEIDPMKTALSLMLALITTTALTEPLPVPKPPGPGGSCPHGYIASGLKRWDAAFCRAARARESSAERNGGTASASTSAQAIRARG